MQAVSICRLCMCHSDRPYNIFVKNGSDGNVTANVISDLLRLEVSECDVYPKIICYACIQKLDDFKNFKDVCMKSKCRFDEDILISKNAIDFLEEDLVAAQPKVKLEESDVIEDLEITNIKSENGAEYEEEVAANNFQDDIEISENLLKCEDDCVNLVFLTSNTTTSNEDGEVLENNNSLFQEERQSFEEKLLIDDPLKLKSSDEEDVPDNMKKDIFGQIKQNNTRSRPITNVIEKTTHSKTSQGTYDERNSSPIKCNQLSNPHTDKMDKSVRIQAEFGETISISNVQEKIQRGNCGEGNKKSKFSQVIVISHLNKNAYNSNQSEERYNSIQSHKKVELKHGRGTYVCDNCAYKTVWKNNLITHMRIHTGERPYQCNLCPKKFTRQYSLNVHLKLHLGDRKFSCDICSRKFITRTNLTYHKKIHNKEWSFFCDFCGKGFFKSSDLKRHKFKHTGIKAFKCDKCNLSFTRKYNLKAHRDTHSENR